MHILFIFRAGAFDGAISISALQWLCNADKSYHKVFLHFFCFEKHWSWCFDGWPSFLILTLHSKKQISAPQAALHVLLFPVRSTQPRQQGCVSILPWELDAGFISNRVFGVYWYLCICICSTQRTQCRALEIPMTTFFRWRWSQQQVWRLDSQGALLLTIPIHQRSLLNII